jgi:hypothetical protein
MHNRPKYRFRKNSKAKRVLRAQFECVQDYFKQVHDEEYEVGLYEELQDVMATLWRDEE